jgi:hypothetical protein
MWRRKQWHLQRINWSRDCKYFCKNRSCFETDLRWKRCGDERPLRSLPSKSNYQRWERISY